MQTRRRRILYLTQRVPYPPNRGDRIRSYHLLKYLANRGDVSLGCLADEQVSPETHDVLRRFCRETCLVRVGWFQRWWRAVISMACGATATEAFFYSARLKRSISRWRRESPFDEIFVFCSSMGQYLDACEPNGTPVILDLVDVDSQKWFDYSASCGGIMKLVYGLEGSRLRRLEQRLGRRVGAVTFSSEREVELYRRFSPDAAVHGIPNGVDLEYFHPNGASPSKQPTCVFVGVLDYRPNVDAVTWFCDQVWPEILRRKPEARFTIVGRNPTTTVRRLADRPGVTLEANVPDVRPFLAAATFMVAPLRIARGVQNKVLEAMAMGKAVVATPAALAGLELRVGEDALSATSAAEWIDMLDALFVDAERCRMLGVAGRRYVETHHNWDRCLDAFGRLSDALFGSTLVVSPNQSFHPGTAAETSAASQ